MCDEWKLDFKNFYRDMGDPPVDPISGERMSLERIDNDKGYNKENCCWANRYAQQKNKSSTPVLIKGKIMKEHCRIETDRQCGCGFGQCARGLIY